MQLWPILIGTLLLIHLPMVILYGVQVWEFLRFYRSRTRWLAQTSLESPRSSQTIATSRVAEASESIVSRCFVVVPCCGDEPGLANHLRSLMEQDYPNYQVRCVVATLCDPAVPRIRECMERYGNMELIVAGSPEFENGVPSEGYKIHSLLAATREIPADCEYLAFFDSDIQLQPWTLRSLTSRFTADFDVNSHRESGKSWNDPIGVATGYRWLIPTRLPRPREKATATSPCRDRHPANVSEVSRISLWKRYKTRWNGYKERGSVRFGSVMVAGINAAVGVLFGKHTPTFVWGGAWAIPRILFDKLEIRRRWRGQLSDDMVVREALVQSNWRACFEPGAIVIGDCDFTFLSGLRFLRRQYQFIRHMAPLWWWFALIVLAIGQLAFWLPPIVWSTIGDYGTPWGWIGLLWGVMVLLKMVIALRIHLAQRGVRGIGGGIGVSGSGPLMGFFHLIAVCSAGVGRTLLWRGIRYKIDAQSR